MQMTSYTDADDVIHQCRRRHTPMQMTSQETRDSPIPVSPILGGRLVVELKDLVWNPGQALEELLVRPVAALVQAAQMHGVVDIGQGGHGVQAHGHLHTARACRRTQDK